MNNGRRVIAFIIDHFIACIMVICLFFCLGFILDWNNDHLYNYIGIYFILYYVFITCKDLLFKNASVGKKMFGLKVVKDNNSNLSSIILILRNTLVFLWPIEILFLLIKNKKIEDIIFKTQVIDVKILPQESLIKNN